MAHHPPDDRQTDVLRAVAEGRVRRDPSLGVLAPHVLDDRDVNSILRSLVFRRLVMLRPIGQPLLTRRGLASLQLRPLSVGDGPVPGRPGDRTCLLRPARFAADAADPS